MNYKREASGFWDIHSVADYPSHVVQLEYTKVERITLVAIANDLNLLAGGHHEGAKEGKSKKVFIP